MAAPADAVLRFQGAWGGEGAGPGQFPNPQAVTVDDANGVYVADTFNHRIQRFIANRQLHLGVGHRTGGAQAS